MVLFRSSPFVGSPRIVSPSSKGAANSTPAERENSPSSRLMPGNKSMVSPEALALAETLRSSTRTKSVPREASEVVESKKLVSSPTLNPKLDGVVRIDETKMSKH